MLKNINFFVNTFNDHIDYWNLKPPLSFWVIAMGYKIAGFNALGLRIASAFFTLLTILVVGLFVKYIRGSLSSIISILTLSTSTQYILFHGARTGDPDALFVFLFTISIISMLLFDRKINFLYLMGFCFSLAFLTKSWHAGSIPVIIGIYLITTGKIKRLTIINWFLLISSAVLPIIIWGIVRYQYDGMLFFSNMISYDLLKRSSSTIGGHRENINYYFGLLINPRYFGYWLSLFVFLILCLFKTIKRSFAEHKDNIIGIILWVFIPLLLFSLPKTKLAWYILPIFPPLAIVIGSLGGKILDSNGKLYKTIAAVGIFICFSGYELNIFHIISNPSKDSTQELIYSIRDNQQYQGKKIFTTNNVEHYNLPYRLNDWRQDEALTTKLYANLIPEDGGFQKFNNSKYSLLLLSKEQFEKLHTKGKYKVVVKNDEYFIISK